NLLCCLAIRNGQGKLYLVVLIISAIEVAGGWGGSGSGLQTAGSRDRATLPIIQDAIDLVAVVLSAAQVRVSVGGRATVQLHGLIAVAVHRVTLYSTGYT